GSSPKARYTHQMMTYDTLRNRVVLFGGLDAGGKALGETWEFDGSKWTQQPIPVGTGPDPRFSHTLVYCSAFQCSILFGGVDNTGSYRNDLWYWNGISWTQPAAPGSSPPARAKHSAAFDSSRGVMVVFGGQDPNGYLNEVREWDGLHWSGA